MEIQYSRQAEKFLKKQDTATRNRILSAVNDLPAGDVRKLQGRDGYRLRIGNCRVIFDYLTKKIIFIEKIDSRGQVYRK